MLTHRLFPSNFASSAARGYQSRDRSRANGWTIHHPLPRGKFPTSKLTLEMPKNIDSEKEVAETQKKNRQYCIHQLCFSSKKLIVMSKFTIMHTVIYMRHGPRFISQCPHRSPVPKTRCASMTEAGRGEGWRDGGPKWLRCHKKKGTSRK